MVSYIFQEMSKRNKKKPYDAQTCRNIVEVKPELWQQMLSVILNIIIYEDCRNQWSMSRPLLGLILLNEDYFNQLRQTIISQQQPIEKQVTMNQLFDGLMQGIERNLLAKNRDRYVFFVLFRKLKFQHSSIFRIASPKTCPHSAASWATCKRAT